MEQSMQLQQTVLRGVVRLLDDNEAMKKLQKFIDKLVSDKEKCQEKQRVADDIKDSITGFVSLNEDLNIIHDKHIVRCV